MRSPDMFDLYRASPAQHTYHAQRVEGFPSKACGSVGADRPRGPRRARGNLGNFSLKMTTVTLDVVICARHDMKRRVTRREMMYVLHRGMKRLDAK